MMNTNREHATKIAWNEGERSNYDEAKKAPGDDNTISRSFGITDLWSIRRNARAFKIHNRIPRL